MKILYHHRVRSQDGQAVHIAALIAALRALGHEVSVVEPPGYRRSAFGTSSPLLAWLKRHVPRRLYEAMELSYNIPDYVRLGRACRRTKPDFIYERYNLFSVAGVWVSRQARVPLLLEINAPLARERAAFGGLGSRHAANWFEAWTWRRASHALPVTHMLATMVNAAGVPPERMTVIPNAVDLAHFSPVDTEVAKQALGLADKTVMGFAGFMRPWHGLDKIIDFLGRPDVPKSLHLVLIGDGPALAPLQEQARRNGLHQRVTFAGIVGHDRISQYIAAFDIALQPRAVAYASPLKLFEYMALGKAIVAPDQPNIREVLIDGQNALLFDVDELDGLATAVIRLATDAPLRKRLGDAARSTLADKHMSWLDNARRVAAIGVALATRQGAPE